MRLSGHAATDLRVTRELHWLIAPDSFKGTYSAREVALAIARGIDEVAGSDALDVCPVADGGEGTLEILLEALGGWSTQAPAHDPLGRPLTAALGWAREGSLAIVESAGACGLSLVAPAERDPEAASTFGVGELVAAAIAGGAASVVITAGGSASTDAGAGAIEAIESAGGLHGTKLIVLADVRTTFERAAAVFAPQKGADRATVERLSARLHAQAATLPRDPRGVPMSGAAGGLAGGLWARYDADIAPGAAWVLDALGFEQRLARARAVITGEGRLDAQTLEGKAVGEISRRCTDAGVPAHALVGAVALNVAELEQLALASVMQAGDLGELERAGRMLAGAACSA